MAIRRRKPSTAARTATSNASATSTSTTTSTTATAPPTCCCCLSAATRLYLLHWCLHYGVVFFDTQILQAGFGALDLRNHTAWDVYLLYPLMVCLTGLLLMHNDESSTSTSNSTARLLLALSVGAHVIDICIRWSRMPLIWDHEHWATVVNVAFVCCFIGSAVTSMLPRSVNVSVVAASSTTSTTGLGLARLQALFFTLARIQLGILYIAAAFWKVTTSFMDPLTSCGSVLILEFFGAYTGRLALPLTFWDFMAQTAPHQTLLIEGGLGVAMLYLGVYSRRSSSSSSLRTVRDATVATAILFHLILIMGPVNSAGGFSNECLSRFVLFFDAREAARLSSYVRAHPLSATLLALAVTVGLIALRYTFVTVIWDTWFWAAGGWTAMYVLLMAGSRGDTTTPKATTSSSSSKTATVVTALITSVALGVCLLYSFVTTILGLQQMGAPTMYANLRYFDGGNHLLVPVATLGEDVLFGGGTVHVLHSTCFALNRKLGRIPSAHVFPPRVVELLTATIRKDDLMVTNGTREEGTWEDYRELPFQIFPMCLRNPHSSNVLKQDYETANAPADAIFTPARMPISLVKKALREQQALLSTTATSEDDYEIRLANHATPDRIMILRSDGSCVFANATQGSDCTEDALAAQFVQVIKGEEDDQATAGSGGRVLAYLVHKLLNPYPELLGWKEEMCMS